MTSEKAKRLLARLMKSPGTNMDLKREVARKLRALGKSPEVHPEAYELRMPTFGCRACGAVHAFPFQAMLCDHRDPKPENVLVAL